MRLTLRDICGKKAGAQRLVYDPYAPLEIDVKPQASYICLPELGDGILAG